MVKTLETSPRRVFWPAKRLPAKLLNEAIYAAVLSRLFDLCWVFYLGGLKSCSCSDLNARDSCGGLAEPPVISTVCKGMQSKSV